MLAYFIRRLLATIPIILGVVLLTFVLFFIANKPEDMARKRLGQKATPEAIENWVKSHNYDLPKFFNGNEEGWPQFTETLLYQKCARVLVFELGRSDTSDRDIADEIRRRMGPSLAIAVPTFLLGLTVNITISLIIAFCRGTYLDRWGTIVCVLLMSISSLFYIIGGQFFFAKWFKLFPISGFDWSASMGKFVFLPVVIGVVSGIGRSVRFYRTVMLEEVSKDYVRTARAKGLGESVVMFRHVLKNALIPILTNAVMVIPMLFMGSLIMESFFSIPGLGSMTITAIQANDYAVIRSMTYIGSIMYIAGLLLTDLSYTLADPRITLGGGDTHSLYGRPSLVDVLKILSAFAVLGAAVTGVYHGYEALTEKVNGVTVMKDFGTPVPIIPNLVLLLVLGGLVLFVFRARKSEMWRNAWRQVRRSRVAMVSLAILSLYVLIAVLDTAVWKDTSGKDKGVPRSVLDRICWSLTDKNEEKTYSAPLADTLFTKETVEKKVKRTVGGQVKEEVIRVREKPELKHPGRHLLGTDKTGQDVLYITLKGVRTGLIIGGLTTLIAVPFAIFFGVLAGFFGGWVDVVVQYIYSMLRAIPWPLLVACFMLVSGHGLVQLCIVMGITGWVGLCRLLRGETLKLREREYVQAALALGVSRFRIITKHIVPNVMHLVLISVVLRFSGLVLAEAVLSYIGIGVGPDTASWGSMIDQARSELGREPVVWWNLAGAFVAMFLLVLPANLFADSLRDALDPSLRVRGEGE